jgi:hypothetical protein
VELLPSLYLVVREAVNITATFTQLHGTIVIASRNTLVSTGRWERDTLNGVRQRAVSGCTHSKSWRESNARGSILGA